VDADAAETTPGPYRAVFIGIGVLPARPVLDTSSGRIRFIGAFLWISPQPCFAISYS
jgi:hypothetical protein